MEYNCQAILFHLCLFLILIRVKINVSVNTSNSVSKRGCRGGRQRSIPVLVSNRSVCWPRHRSRHPSDVITLKTIHDSRPLTTVSTCHTRKPTTQTTDKIIQSHTLSTPPRPSHPQKLTSSPPSTAPLSPTSSISSSPPPPPCRLSPQSPPPLRQIPPPSPSPSRTTPSPSPPPRPQHHHKRRRRRQQQQHHQNRDHIKIGLLNTRSCRNKTEEIVDLIDDHQIDILVLTETWLNQQYDQPIMKAMTPEGFRIKSFPRMDRTGGGIAVLYRSSFEAVVTFQQTKFNSFEYASFSICCNNVKKTFHCIYRPPPNSKNKWTYKDFLLEFQDLISQETIVNRDNIFIGDFNIDYYGEKTESKNYRELIFTNNLTQHVHGPTNNHGHTIDHIITEDDFPLSSPVENIDKLISDHHLLLFYTHFKVKQETKKVTCRNIKNINFEHFKEDLSRRLSTSIDAVSFNLALSQTMDEHAPLRTRTVKQRKQSPWYNISMKEAKRARRRAERKWLKSDLMKDKNDYLTSKTNAKKINILAKKLYYNKKFSSIKSAKEFFAETKNLLGQTKKSDLPSQFGNMELPTLFGNHFKGKTEKLRKELSALPLNKDFDSFSGTTLSKFSIVQELDVFNCIMSSASKSCGLDPVATDVLKQSLDVLLTPITNILNESLQSGIVPDIYKIAHVKPLLKKHDLDKENFKNYRPVSNLPFLSKILEKLVLKQILSHLKVNSLEEKFQSAYRQCHSTETALVRVVNDLLSVIDKGSCSLLNLLDLSSAFDTIDHNLLLKRLEITFGLSGTVLDWLKSYLSNRRQIITVNDLESPEILLDCGVPQGSVLGPVLFVLYVSPLSKIIRGFGLSHHQYADDTQLYSSSETNDLQGIVGVSVSCILKIKEWMDENRLKLNDDKTEVMYIASRKKKYDISLRLGETSIDIVDSVKNLGTFLDSGLTMDHQVNHLIKSLFFQLKKIGSIRQFITEDVTKRLMVSLVLSKLDYCNALLFGVSQRNLKRLQVVQNTAARLVYRKQRSDSALPLLHQLHWLPVESRIKFKACVLVFRCLEGTAPPYLSELIQKYSMPRTLRSSSDLTKLSLPRTRTKAGTRSFSYFGPSVWNTLPQCIREKKSLSSFKRSLKTHLFPSL